MMGFLFGDGKLFGYSSESVKLVLTGVVRIHPAPQQHRTDKALVEAKEEVNLGGCMPNTTVCTKTSFKVDNG